MKGRKAASVTATPSGMDSQGDEGGIVLRGRGRSAELSER